MERRIFIEKIEERSDAEIAGNQPVGKYKEGYFIREPHVGQCFWVYPSFRTSYVQQIIDEHTFKTLNSIYRWGYLNKDQ